MILDIHSVLALVAWLLVSLVALYCYGRDKNLAIKHKWRIPERVLLCLGFFGGALGALAGMLLFRHKTKHWYFWVVNGIGLLWQVVFLYYILIVLKKPVVHLLNT